MKIFLSIFVISLVVLIGCDNSTDLSVNNPELSLYRIPNSELIPLPNKSPLWIDSVFTMSKAIDGTVGGRMILEKYYIANDGDSISIEADLSIPAGAFQGTKNITMIVDDNYATVHFYPEMIFDDTLRLFQRFKGLHLENYVTGTFDFVFIRDDGTTELIKNNGLQVVVPQGIVRVQNAKLVHFSRYGWIRKSETPILYQDINCD
jgi:hypothetical protein